MVLHQIIPGLSRYSTTGEVCYEHMNNDFFNYYLAKLASSSAHFDKKKKGRALCEIFGAYGWAEGSKIMKYLMDHMLVRGINWFVPHAFSAKDNDIDCPPNFYARGKNPEYKYFKTFMKYLNRMCHLLNDGKACVTCALLYDAEIRWAEDDFLPLEMVAKELYDNQLDYDIIPVDALLDVGKNYPVIVVPDKKGLTQYAHDLLLNYNVIYANEVKDLTSHIKADIKVSGKFPYLRYCHYVRDDVNFYMFTNEDIHDKIKTTLKLSDFSGGEYIEYDAMENKAYKKTDINGEIGICLEPYQSTVIACGNINLDGVGFKKEKIIVNSQIIKSEYKISLARENEDFVFYKKTDKLFNITGKEGIPAFSGHIKYEADILVKESGEFLLDLGYLGEIAELFVNGEYIGTKLIPPYKFDIKDKLKCGNNHLEIIITNHAGYREHDRFSKFLLFEPSGLLGPVTLYKYKEKSI